MIQTERDGDARIGKMKELLSELIGHHNDSTGHFGRKSVKKPSEGWIDPGVGKVRTDLERLHFIEESLSC